jgi:sugar/nucleoside kinase (ribokinase family)
MGEPPAVSCFSYLASVQTLYVKRYPEINYGIDVDNSDEFLAGDGPIVAAALQALGHRAILGTNHVADDPPGNAVLSRLGHWGLTPAAGPDPAARTRTNIVVCDEAGNRTWYSRLRGIAAELAGVDVALLASSPHVYIDCYEVLGAAPRAVLTASLAAGASVTLNLGGSPPPAWLEAATRRRPVSILQTSARKPDPHEARRTLDAMSDLRVAETVVVTMGEHGAIARTQRGLDASAYALDVDVRQVQGAGSVFSAALIHATSTGSNLDDCLQFACAAGSLWCSQEPGQDPPRRGDITRALP